MPVTVQIENVPEELHLRLQERASKAGMTVSDYLLRDLKRSLEMPGTAKFLERLKSRDRVDLGEPAALAVAEEREDR